MATIALTTKALVGIILGSAGGGLVVGGAVGYLIKNSSRDEEAELEYKRLDAESSFREKQRQYSINSTYHRVSQITEETLSDIAQNQKRASTSIAELNRHISSAQKFQESGRVVIDETIQDNETIKQLMAELKSKTEQLIKVTNDYEELKVKLAEAVKKLEQALAELDFIRKTIRAANGEKDYIGQVIETMKRMRYSNDQLKARLDVQIQNYEKAEQRIGSLTENLREAKKTILEQEKTILGLQKEVREESSDKGKDTNLRFF